MKNILIRATYILACILSTSGIIGQCECGEDLTPPTFAGDVDVTLDQCAENTEPYAFIVSDNCTENPSVNVTPVLISSEYCGLTPIITSACEIAEPWNLKINNITDGMGSFHALSFGFRRLADGNARLTGLLQSTRDTSAYIEVSILLEGELVWSQLVNENPMNVYRPNCSGIDALYQTWSYYRISPDNSYLEGRGSMEGTLLYLNPYPADFTERVQLGNGANTFNLNNGLWAQCTFSGSLIYSGTNLSIDIAELGQIAGDFTCCASEMNEIKYNATDNCNNLGTANQWVEIRDIDLPAFSMTPQSSEQIICDGYPINTPSAYDQCSDVTVRAFQLNTNYWFVATDACGNNNISKSQITVLPALGETCDYYGCTNPLSSWYNPNAIIDDGSCNFYPVTAIAFIDDNFNGSFDANEAPLQGATITTSAEPGLFITDQFGSTQFFIDRNSEDNLISIDYSSTGFIDPTTPEEIVMSGFNVSPIVYFGIVPSFNQDNPLYLNLVAQSLPCQSNQFDLTVNLTNTFTNTISGTIVSFVLPEYCTLVNAANLLEQLGDTIYLEMPTINQGGSSTAKMTLAVDRESLIASGATDFTVQSLITNYNIQNEHRFPIYCEGNNNAALSAAPGVNNDEMLIAPQKINYHFTYTATALTTDFGLTILPSTTDIPFDPQSIASDKIYSLEISNNPLRYDLHFDNLILEEGESISLTYAIDASEEQNGRLISQRIQFIANGVYGTSNWVDRKIVDCRSYDITYWSNLESCLINLEFYSESDFYTNFDWYVNDSLYLSASNALIISPDDTLETIRIEAYNFICQTSEVIAIEDVFIANTLEISHTETSFCAGESVTFTALSNSDSVHWYINDELLSTGISFQAFESGSVIAEVAENGPCPAISRQVDIQQIALPQVQIDFDNDSTICENESQLVLFSANQPNFTIFLNDLIATENPLTIDTTSTVLITASNLCGSTQQEQSFTFVSLPEIGFETIGNTSFCDGESVNINVEGSGDIVVLANNQQVTSTPFNVFDNTSLLATATNICGSVSEELDIVVYPIPSADFTYNNTAQSITAIDEGQYQWLLNGQPISDAVNPTYFITETGPYSLSIVSPFGCQNTSSIEFINYVMLQEPSADDVEIFPNPANEYVQIRNTSQSWTTPFSIYNELGQLMRNEFIYPGKTVAIDVQHWPSGIYIVVWNNHSKKLTVNR